MLHKATVHTPICEICNQKFSRSRDVARHKRDVHGEGKYLCEVCGTVFSQPMSLEQHRKKMHGILPTYTCDICNRKLSRARDVKVHKKNVHKIHPMMSQSSTSDQPIASQSDDGMSRIIPHPFRCRKCNGRFQTNRELVRHRLLRHQTVGDEHLQPSPFSNGE